jgi:Integral membrane protein (PIN domain superfamily)
MPLWIFRASAIFGFPFLIYMFVARDIHSILLGLMCGIILVAAEYFIRSLKFVTLMIGLFGALAGYVLYFLADYAVYRMAIPDISNYWYDYKTVAAGVFTVMGGFLSIIKARELEGLSKKGSHIKVVDMSALIDGRVVDLCETGFLSGVLVVPQFVIEKLNSLSSSKDPLEKAKGRRGLDIITRLRELKIIPIRVTSKEPKGETMAEQIVWLAKNLGGQAVTIDFNVNKAGAIEDVQVLNIRDLTTALKPVVLPGESMSLFVMKDGKEKEQGIGYLDDGTMVVVEDGRKWVGKRVEVAVYSILQTSAGRMIFAKTKQPAAEE